MRKTISSSLPKRVLAESSGCCIVPGCRVAHNLEIHHIDGDSSNNDPGNLIALCPNHHTAADRRQIIPQQCRDYRKRALRLRKVMPDVLRALDPLVGQDIPARLSARPYGKRARRFRVRWSCQGPVIHGNGVVLSASETNALLDRWTECIHKFIRAERRNYEKDGVGALERALFLASIRAFGSTYNRIPEASEVDAGRTELVRKCFLWHRFTRAAFADYVRKEMRARKPRGTRSTT